MNNHNIQGPMTLFRIFVEDVGERDLLKTIITEHFGDDVDATIIFGQGLWKGRKKHIAIIEIYAPESFIGTVNVLAIKLRVAFNQKAVAVAEHYNRVSFYYV